MTNLELALTKWFTKNFPGELPESHYVLEIDLGHDCETSTYIVVYYCDFKSKTRRFRRVECPDFNFVKMIRDLFDG